MSLINEALKRAREEAARRQAAEKGLPLANPRPARERARWLSVAVVVLAGALLISLAVLVNISAKLPASDPPTPASIPETAPPTTSPVPLSESSVQLEAEDSASSAEDIADLAGPVTHEASAQPPDVADPEKEESSPAAPGKPHQDFDSLSQPRVFVGQAQLRDGQLVDLEGIAWSESEPFALLNGQVVGVGEFIRSYRVTEILQDRVTLEQDDDSIVLHLQ